MTTREMIRDLSDEAKSALLAAKNHHQGTTIMGSVPAMVELAAFGLVGPLAGLTRRGSIVAQFVREEALEDAFGF